jgi:hypothetical protein
VVVGVRGVRLVFSDDSDELPVPLGPCGQTSLHALQEIVPVRVTERLGHHRGSFRCVGDYPPFTGLADDLHYLSGEPDGAARTPSGTFTSNIGPHQGT